MPLKRKSDVIDITSDAESESREAGTSSLPAPKKARAGATGTSKAVATEKQTAAEKKAEAMEKELAAFEDDVAAVSSAFRYNPCLDITDCYAPLLL